MPLYPSQYPDWVLQNRQLNQEALQNIIRMYMAQKQQGQQNQIEQQRVGIEQQNADTSKGIKDIQGDWYKAQAELDKARTSDVGKPKGRLELLQYLVSQGVPFDQASDMVTKYVSPEEKIDTAGKIAEKTQQAKQKYPTQTGGAGSGKMDDLHTRLAMIDSDTTMTPEQKKTAKQYIARLSPPQTSLSPNASISSRSKNQKFVQASNYRWLSTLPDYDATKPSTAIDATTNAIRSQYAQTQQPAVVNSDGLSMHMPDEYKYAQANIKSGVGNDGDKQLLQKYDNALTYFLQNQQRLPDYKSFLADAKSRQASKEANIPLSVFRDWYNYYPIK